MKRRVTPVLLLAGLPVALAVALLATPNMVLNSEQVRESLSRSISRSLAMPLEIASAKFTPWSGLAASIRIPAPGEDRQAPPFLDAPGLRVRFRLLPLLQSRLVIQQVSVEGPTISLTRDRDGQFLIPSLAPKPSAPKEPAPEHVAPAPQERPSREFQVELGAIDVERARLVCTDAKGKPILSVDGFKFRANLAPATRAVEGSVEAEKITVRNRLEICAVHSPIRYTDGTLELDGLTATLANGTIDLKLKFAETGEGRPLSAEMKVAGVNLEQLVAQCGGEADRITGTLEGNATYSARIDDPTTARAEARLHVGPGRFVHYPIFQTVGELLQIQELVRLDFERADLHATLKGRDITIRSAEIRAPTIRFDGKGKIKEMQKLDIDARLLASPGLQKRLPDHIGKRFEALPDDPSWAALEFDVTGTLKKPKTNIEEKLIGKNRIEAIGGILGDLLKLGAPQPAAPPNP